MILKNLIDFLDIWIKNRFENDFSQKIISSYLQLADKISDNKLKNDLKLKILKVMVFLIHLSYF